MTRAIAYVRVSTDRQASEGVSLEAQRERLAAWCLAHGHELAAVYVDAGLSGKRADNRPELTRALADVEGSGGVLVVYSLSRLARSTKDTIAIAERLDRAGADLVSLSESIDTTSAAGRMVFRMLAVLAEFERDLVSERTKAALAHKRAQGFAVSKHAPFGWRIEDGRLVEDDDEQAALEIVRRLRASGLSLRAIADRLNEDGIPARGARWHRTTVERLLKRAA